MNRLLSVHNYSKRIVPTLITVYFVEVCDFYNFLNNTLKFCLLKFLLGFLWAVGWRLGNVLSYNVVPSR